MSCSTRPVLTPNRTIIATSSEQFGSFQSLCAYETDVANLKYFDVFTLFGALSLSALLFYSHLGRGPYVIGIVGLGTFHGQSYRKCCLPRPHLCAPTTFEKRFSEHSASLCQQHAAPKVHQRANELWNDVDHRKLSPELEEICGRRYRLCESLE